MHIFYICRNNHPDTDEQIKCRTIIFQVIYYFVQFFKLFLRLNNVKESVSV